MANLTSDEYWKESTLSGFNFDDDITDEAVPASSFGDAVLTLKQDVTLPIHSIISKRGLNCILQDTKLPIRSNAPLVEETVQKLFLGIPCVLDQYRTLKQKDELLQQVCSTSDGNAILKVILHLKKTLSNSLFHYQVSKNKLALSQYCNYLVQQHKYQELHFLYMAIGSTNELINTFYLPAQSYTSIRKARDEIDIFLNNFGAMISNFNKVTLSHYQFFLDTLFKNNTSCEYPTEYLSSLYEHNIAKNLVPHDVLLFCSSLKIENYQQHWIHLNVLAQTKMWDKLLQTFVKPNALLKKIKCDVDVEMVVTTLNKHEAPKHVLHQFLHCIGDTEKAMYLGRKFLCYKFVIEKLIESRDRAGLLDYKRIVPSQSEDFFQIEKALCSDRKWKN